MKSVPSWEDSIKEVIDSLSVTCEEIDIDRIPLLSSTTDSLRVLQKVRTFFWASNVFSPKSKMDPNISKFSLCWIQITVYNWLYCEILTIHKYSLHTLEEKFGGKIKESETTQSPSIFIVFLLEITLWVQSSFDS